MDERLTPAGDPEHRNAQLHLSWYATGQLEPAEQARVARHVAGCAACRADLALDAALGDHAPDAPLLSADAGWTRLAARLAGDRATTSSPAPSRRRAPALFADWRGWAIAAQFVLIVLLAAWLADSQGSPDAYRTLQSTQPAARGDLLVMFAPDTPERSLRELLGRADARVVDGPTVTGAYVLAAPQGGQRPALEALRASPAVTLAEPLGPEAAP